MTSTDSAAKALIMLFIWLPILACVIATSFTVFGNISGWLAIGGLALVVVVGVPVIIGLLLYNPFMDEAMRESRSIDWLNDDL